MQLFIFGQCFLEANKKTDFCGNKLKDIFQANESLEAFDKYWQMHRQRAFFYIISRKKKPYNFRGQFGST